MVFAKIDDRFAWAVLRKVVEPLKAEPAVIRVRRFVTVDVSCGVDT
jgi:hypothetical protein